MYSALVLWWLAFDCYVLPPEYRWVSWCRLWCEATWVPNQESSHQYYEESVHRAQRQEGGLTWELEEKNKTKELLRSLDGMQPRHLR